MQSDLLKAIVRTAVPRQVRNWLRSPSKSAEWLWHSTLFRLGATRTLDLSSGFSMVCHPHAYKLIYDAQIRDSEQHEEFLNFLPHCCDRMLLFDIGAHYGVFSLAAAHFGGTAIAADPSPTATRMIETEAALNGWSSRIHILRNAVSDKNGVMDMLTSGVFSAGYYKVVKGRSKRDLTATQALTIDQIACQFGAPTHIKIDVEGHEAAVLRGARRVLRQASPILFLELHNEMIASEGGDPSAALDELSSLGYEVFTLNGEKINRSAILDRPLIRVTSRREGE
jgi:FkbM family methyltransferase